jgi:hypothetical protein
LGSPVAWIGVGDCLSVIILYNEDRKNNLIHYKEWGLNQIRWGTSKKGATSSTRFKQQTEETGFTEIGLNFNHADGKIVLLADSSKPARSHSLRGSASTDVSHQSPEARSARKFKAAIPIQH